MVHPFSQLETEYRKQNTGNRIQETDYEKQIFLFFHRGIDKPPDMIEEY
jgi:hypothetical protein